MKKNYIFTYIISMILVVIVGTYAWLSWRSNDTSLLLTIGDIQNVQVKLNPYQINTSIAPRLNYSGITDYITIEANNNSINVSNSFRLYLTINDIDEELKNENFKYTMLRSTNNSTYTEYSNGSGNFANLGNNTELTILTENIPANKTYKYKLYIWLDGSGSAQSENLTFNANLMAEILDNPETMRNSVKILETLQSIGYSNQDGVYYFDNNGDLDYGDGTVIRTNISSSNLQIPKGVVSIHNNQVVYLCTNYNDVNYEYDLVTKEVKARDMPCITTRYQNLVINGDLSMSSNLNLSSFGTYQQDGNGGYITTTLSSSPTLVSTDYIPIDPSKKYTVGLDMKSSNTQSTYYVGFAEYDVDKKMINSWNYMYIANTLTTLAEDLKPGDTVVYLTNLTNWKTENVAKNQRGFIFWNYVDSTGYQYPELTYSMNVYNSNTDYSNLYLDSAVDKNNSEISLINGWQGPLIPMGTKISQSNSGAARNYSVLGGKTITTDWNTYQSPYNIIGTITNGDYNSYKFRSGTKYIRFMIMENYNGIADTTTDIRNLYIREVQE